MLLAHTVEIALGDLRIPAVGPARPEEQLAKGDAGFHVGRGCHPGGGEVRGSIDAAIAVIIDLYAIPDAHSGGGDQIHREGDGLSVFIADPRRPCNLRRAAGHIHLRNRGDVHAEAGSQAEIRAREEVRGGHSLEDLRDFRPEGQGGAGGAAQLECAAVAAVQALHRGKGRDNRLVAAQQQALRGGIDVAMRAGCGERLVGLALQLEILDRARLLLRVPGLPVRLLRLEIIADRVHRSAGGQHQRPGQAVRNLQGQAASADEGRIRREAGVQALGEREQRVPGQDGRIYDGLLNEKPGIGGILLPAGSDHEGHLGARNQLAQPLIRKAQHRAVAVSSGECLHHGRVFGRVRVHGIAQLYLAVPVAVQLDGEGQIRRVFRRDVTGARLGENIPAVKAAHDQVGRAVVLLQVDGSGFAAAKPDGLHLMGAPARRLDAQAQLQLIVLVRAQVAHKEDRVALGVGHLRLGLPLRMGHRDRRAAERLAVRVKHPNAELMRGQGGYAEIRLGVFALFQLGGVCGKAGGGAGMHPLHIDFLQCAAACIDRAQVAIVIPADGADDLPNPGFSLQHAVIGGRKLRVLRPAALKQLDAVENRQAILLQLRFKAGEGILRLHQLPFCIHKGAGGQLLDILDRAQQAAHPGRQEPVCPLPHRKGIHAR